jgi:hypothetical protein
VTLNEISGAASRVLYIHVAMRVVGRATLIGEYLPVGVRGASYSNASDKPWQTVVLNGTWRIQTTVFERAAAIC